MSNTVFLIDASIYIFQAYFSPRIQIYSEDGRDQSAFFGFTQFLLRFLNQTRPDFTAAAFDNSLFTGFRHQLCPNYKSNRLLPDQDLARQLEACAQMCELLGIRGFSSAKFEADDIIGTIAGRVRNCIVEAEGSRAGDARLIDPLSDTASVCIVTRDKDLAQLVTTESDHLWDYSVNKRRFRSDIIQQYRVRPEQFPDYLGLVGDPGDRIAGVPGLGPVAAACILDRFGDLTSLYQRLDEVATLSYRGARNGAQLLTRFRAEAELGRTLATIVVDVDDSAEGFSTTTRDDIRRQGPNIEDAIRLLDTHKIDLSRIRRFVQSLERLTGQEP